MSESEPLYSPDAMNAQAFVLMTVLCCTAKEQRPHQLGEITQTESVSGTGVDFIMLGDFTTNIIYVKG